MIPAAELEDEDASTLAKEDAPAADLEDSNSPSELVSTAKDHVRRVILAAFKLLYFTDQQVLAGNRTHAQAKHWKCIVQRIGRWKNGRMAVQKNSRMEVWKNGRMAGWKLVRNGRMEWPYLLTMNLREKLF